MITRIVKLTFQTEEVNSFLAIYEDINSKIIGMDGCTYLSLHRDDHQKNVFFTISQWHDEKALNAYRETAFFKNVWSKFKSLFAAKPEAWTISNLHNTGTWQVQS